MMEAAPTETMLYASKSEEESTARLRASVSVVVMNLPDAVDGEVLLRRFGAVLRTSASGGGANASCGPSSSPKGEEEEVKASSSVRFTTKQWCVDGADVPVRIAFVDIDGGQTAANAVISAVRNIFLDTQFAHGGCAYIWRIYSTIDCIRRG